MTAPTAVEFMTCRRDRRPPYMVSICWRAKPRERPWEDGFDSWRRRRRRAPTTPASTSTARSCSGSRASSPTQRHAEQEQARRELEQLKQSLRERAEAVAERERELAELQRRLGRRASGRSRRSRRSRPATPRRSPRASAPRSSGRRRSRPASGSCRRAPPSSAAESAQLRGELARRARAAATQLERSLTERAREPPSGSGSRSGGGGAAASRRSSPRRAHRARASSASEIEARAARSRRSNARARSGRRAGPVRAEREARAAPPRGEARRARARARARAAGPRRRAERAARARAGAPPPRGGRGPPDVRPPLHATELQRGPRGVRRSRSRAPLVGSYRPGRRGPPSGGPSFAMSEYVNPVDPPDLGLLPTFRRLLRLWRAEWRLGVLGARARVRLHADLDRDPAADPAARSTTSIVAHTRSRCGRTSLAIVVLAGVRFVINFSRRFATARIGIRIEARMRELLYQRVPALPARVLRPPRDRSGALARDERPLPDPLLHRLGARAGDAEPDDDRRRGDRARARRTRGSRSTRRSRCRRSPCSRCASRAASRRSRARCRSARAT